MLLLATGFVAGTMNAVAGGGPLLTLPILILAGLDGRSASMTSTVALFPGQIATGVAARKSLHRVGGVPLAWLLTVNVVGGAIGAALLVATPSSVFSALVPWLVLFATAIYAWSSFGITVRGHAPLLNGPVFIAAQVVLSIYGGYFGGGNCFMMLAALLLAGSPARAAGEVKNLLIALINTAAVVVLVFSPAVAFDKALAVGIGAMAGSLTGVWILARLDERVLRLIVVGIGIALTVWLFVRG